MKILDVGQCGFDGPRMARLWHDTLGAKVDNADTSDDAAQKVQTHHYDLVLVNRLLAADKSSGLDVIARLLKLSPTTPVMLVSDHPEAQDAAVQLGAQPGFGKAHLGDRSTLELVSQVTNAQKGEPRKES